MKKLWFKRKYYGWGWRPSSWEGWLVLLVYVLALRKVFIVRDRLSHSGSDTIIGITLPVIVLTIILILICYIKGEKPKWQWGKQK